MGLNAQLEQISSAIHSKAVTAGQRRCSASIQFAVTRPDLTFQRQASHALSYRRKSIFAFHGALTISHAGSANDDIERAARISVKLAADRTHQFVDDNPDSKTQRRKKFS
jgi:hypothetical protein